MVEVTEVAGWRAAGVGDDDVVGGGPLPAEVVRGVECLRAAGFGGDVGGDLDHGHAGLLPDGRSRGGERLGGAGDEHEVDALARERQRAAAPEALARRAYQCGLAAKSEIHAISLRR